MCSLELVKLFQKGQSNGFRPLGQLYNSLGLTRMSIFSMNTISQSALIPSFCRFIPSIRVTLIPLFLAKPRLTLWQVATSYATLASSFTRPKPPRNWVWASMQLCRHCCRVNFSLVLEPQRCQLHHSQRQARLSLIHI